MNLFQKIIFKKVIDMNILPYGGLNINITLFMFAVLLLMHYFGTCIYSQENIYSENLK